VKKIAASMLILTIMAVVISGCAHNQNSKKSSNDTKSCAAPDPAKAVPKDHPAH
jgi:uncharacterized lipoprotein